MPRALASGSLWRVVNPPPTVFEYVQELGLTAEGGTVGLDIKTIQAASAERNVCGKSVFNGYIIKG